MKIKEIKEKLLYIWLYKFWQFYVGVKKIIVNLKKTENGIKIMEKKTLKLYKTSKINL